MGYKSSQLVKGRASQVAFMLPSRQPLMSSLHQLSSVLIASDHDHPPQAHPPHAIRWWSVTWSVKTMLPEFKNLDFTKHGQIRKTALIYIHSGCCKLIFLPSRRLASQTGSMQEKNDTFFLQGLTSEQLGCIELVLLCITVLFVSWSHNKQHQNLLIWLVKGGFIIISAYAATVEERRVLWMLHIICISFPKGVQLFTQGYVYC